MYGVYDVDDYGAYLSHLWRQFTSCTGFTVSCATLFSIFVSYAQIEKEVFITWFVLSFVNCLLGLFRAVLYGQFSSRKLLRWTWKLFTQLSVVILLASIGRMLHMVTSQELLLANAMLFCFAFLDVTSIINKMISLGWPVPKFIIVVIDLLRGHFVDLFKRRIHMDDKSAADLRVALGGERRRTDAPLEPQAPRPPQPRPRPFDGDEAFLGAGDGRAEKDARKQENWRVWERREPKDTPSDGWEPRPPRSPRDTQKDDWEGDWYDGGFR